MTRLALLLVPFAALVATAPTAMADEAAVTRRVPLMGTTLEITVEGPDRSAALHAGEAAVRALEATEARLSTWRDDSELARFNAAPVGEAVPLSPTLAAELADARRCRETTRGAFDPAVGALTAAWGLRTGGREPTDAERRRAVAASGIEHLDLRDGRATRLRPGVRVDEGAFGKGAGLRAALDALAAHGGAQRALLDLGGQVAVLGGQKPWDVGVAHPVHRDRSIATVRIETGSLATSGTGVRGRHLLDPATGRPAPDFGSVTVWTQDPLAADCLSTGLYVLGPDAASAWATTHRGVELLILQTTSNGLHATATAGMAERLVELAPEVDLVVLEKKEETRATGRSAAKLSSPSPPETLRP